MAKKAAGRKTRAAATKSPRARAARDPKAAPDPPARPIRKEIGPGTTRHPKTLPAMKIDD
jgi:hypothetical protein